MDVYVDSNLLKSVRYSYIVLPLDDKFTHVDCLLTVEGRDYVVHFFFPSYPSFNGCIVNLTWELNIIFYWRGEHNHHELFQKCCSIPDFLDKLVPLIDNFIKEHKCMKPDNLSVTNYSDIVDEVDAIGWEKLASINHDFTVIKIKMFDTMNREHILCVKFTGKEPEFTAEYPRSVNYEWHEGRSCLKDIYTLFCQEAEQYQEFWDVMEELDNGCWVLEPESPSRRDTYRKIAIAPNVSLKIDVDPSHPRLFPSITWLGSEAAVFAFREKVLDKVEVWENDLPIHANLERLLDISLPLKQSPGEGENFEITCCICYSERLNGEVPSRTCDNPHCGQSFHIHCLYEWLRSLIQTTRKQGNKVFGACPNCEQPISCKPPSS